MPSEQSKIGMGRRRQGDTEPDRGDDRNRSLDRAIEKAPDGETEYERGRQSGASGTTTPHEAVKPGTRRDLEEADPGGEGGEGG